MKIEVICTASRAVGPGPEVLFPEVVFPEILFSDKYKFPDVGFPEVRKYSGLFPEVLIPDLNLIIWLTLTSFDLIFFL